MKTLILFSSKYGTTEKCAELISKGLNDQVHMINLKKQKCEHLNDYDVILMGGSVYAGKLQSEIKKIIEENESCLCEKKIGLFVCCKEEGDQAIQYLKSNLPEWIIDKAIIKEHVGHEINLEKMNFVERTLLKGIFKIKESYAKINYEGIEKIVERVNETVI